MAGGTGSTAGAGRRGSLVGGRAAGARPSDVRRGPVVTGPLCQAGPWTALHGLPFNSLSLLRAGRKVLVLVHIDLLATGGAAIPSRAGGVLTSVRHGGPPPISSLSLDPTTGLHISPYPLTVRTPIARWESPPTVQSPCRGRLPPFRSSPIGWYATGATRCCHPVSPLLPCLRAKARWSGPSKETYLWRQPPASVPPSS